MANTSLADFIKRIQNSRDTAFSTAAGAIANAQPDFSDPMMTSAALSSRDTQQQLINTNNAMNATQERFAGTLAGLGELARQTFADTFTKPPKRPRDTKPPKIYIQTFDENDPIWKPKTKAGEMLEKATEAYKTEPTVEPSATSEVKPQEVSLYNKSGVRPAGNFQGQVIQSGYTGPSNFIGGSADYHIDQKFLKGTPMYQMVDTFDNLAAAYDLDGRKIEFSNEGPAGERYDPSQPYEVKSGLIQRVLDAHGRRPHPTHWAGDYYAVKAGAKNRFVPGSVEKAKIYTFVPEGYTARPGMGGGYGLFTDIIDTDNKQIWGRVGHGHTGMPRFATPSITDYGGGAM